MQIALYFFLVANNILLTDTDLLMFILSETFLPQIYLNFLVKNEGICNSVVSVFVDSYLANSELWP